MSQVFDVFNGDADGICALLQLRQHTPCSSHLVTGVKRDIALLQRVEAQAGDQVTVLDISLDKNRQALLALLERGARVRYFDHHYPGGIPRHPNLEAHIDTHATVCTSLLVNRHLEGARAPWAVVGAFGDNLDQQARELGGQIGLAGERLEALRQLGQLLNYNGYGASLDDLHIAPDALFVRLLPHHDPFDFIQQDATFARLQQGFASDMAHARQLRPALETSQCALYILPDQAWARRVSGVFANQLAQAQPQRAHALLTQRPGGYLVSVRAPLARREGADELCRQFDTGGGREAAAGINHLPEGDYERFVAAFQRQYQERA